MALTREEAIKKLQEQQAASGVKEEFRQPISEQAIQAELGGPAITGGGVTPTPTTPTAPADAREKTLGEIQRQKRINTLRAEREKVMGALSGQEAEIAPVFREQVGRARTETAQSGRRFSDFLAERGLQASGLAGAGEIARTAGLQQQIGGIREQEAGAFADIARQRAEADIGFQAGVREAEFAEQELAAQQRLAQEQLASERAFAQQQAEAERAIELENFQIEAAIREAQSVNDFGREQQLLNLRNQNDIKLANIRNAGALAEIRLKAEVSPDTTKEPKLSDAEMVGLLQQDVNDVMNSQGLRGALAFLEQNKLPLMAQFGEDQGAIIYEELRNRVATQDPRAVVQGVLGPDRFIFPER